ncbi:phospholipase D-like domain-containing protein [bacterium]|jgi:HKD family nuclease|nr:phospholipase D-like domain-containing protein [bacterium]
MSKFKSLFFAGIVCFLISSFSFAEVLCGEAYQETLCKHIANAKDSIVVAMYFIISEPEGEGPINELVDGLIAAKARGVDVKVILEDSKFKENRLAYQKLKDNGVKVHFDTPEHLLHVKGVVIDGRYVFIGSANWSKAAIEDNYEVTCFEESPEDGLAFKQYIEGIPLQDTDMFLPPEEGVFISSDLLLFPETGRILIKNQAEKQLDLYLLLCKVGQEKGADSFKVDYDALAKKMGYAERGKLGKYRNRHEYNYERIHRSLASLKRNGLIDYSKGVVSLKINGGAPITIPFEYWDYADELSMRAKYMYLICLYEAGRSTRYPCWFRSQKDMEKLYGISDTTISLGLLELESKGIIEVTRDKLSPPDFSDRNANVYKMLAFPKFK